MIQNSSTQPADRRRHRRFSIDLNVNVSRGDEPALIYRMRDYCESGVLLVAATTSNEQKAAYTPPFVVGQRVEVSGRVQHSAGRRELGFTVEVVRLVEGGFGARFLRPETRLFELLRRHTSTPAQQKTVSRAHRSPRQGPSGTPITHTRIKVMFGRLAAQMLSEPLRRVLANTELELLDRFNKASTTREEQQIFTDLSTLELAKSELDKHLLQPLLKRAIQGSRDEDSEEQNDLMSDQLSLVDKADFEKWVQVAKASTRLDDLFCGQLHDLSVLIQALPSDNVTAGELEVPFSPLQITDELNNLSARLDLSPISHRQLLDTTIKVLSQELGTFYRELSSALQDLAGQPGVNSAIRQSVAEQTPGYAATTSVKPPTGPANRTPATAVSSPPLVKTTATGTTAAIVTNSPSETIPSATLTVADATPRAATDNSVPPTGPAVAIETLSVTPGKVLGIGDLSRLLPQLHAEALAGAPVLQERLRLMASAETARGVKLAPAAKERAAFAGELLDFLLNDYCFPAQTAPLLEAVQVPLVQAILTDSDFFQKKDHPALRLIDQLEHLSSFISNEQDSPKQTHIRRSIEQALVRLHQFDGDDRILHETVESLSELTTAQSRDYQHNVERLVSTCTGQERLKLSRIRVKKELNHRYGGHQVPAVAVQLLDVGWRALLELAYLRDGENSPQFRQYLSLFDNTVHHLGGDPYKIQASPIKRIELLRALEEGLSSTSFDPLRRTEVLERLNSALLDREGETDAPALELVSFPTTTEVPESAHLAAKKDIPESAWHRVMDKVNALEVGDRVSFTDENGDNVPLRVAWISDVDSTLTLVNQQGLKAKELSLAELARSLHFRQVTSTPAEQNVLSERAAQDMLKRMEDRLSYHTSHDSLTGLYNRPQFQSALEQALNKDGNGAGQVLCWMNLDNFAVFNDSCGYEVGDKLLVTVAGMLEQHFGEKGILGHLGGDKFGALLDDCSSQRGTHLAETFRSAVERIPFYWNGRSMPVSVSVALVDLAEAGDSLTQLMQAADAALSAAKQARGNQVYRYDASDHKIREQRESMQWMLQVNQALDHGRLKLRCQKISPIDPGKGFSPHYEVLLGVTDESGESLHIGNFISAAEKYNRMAQVDRWVVSTAISWVAEQKQQLPGLGGFAVNLSGHTLNDEGFIAFVGELFRKTQLPPEYISFEVTETLAIANLDRARRIIHALKDLGCTFALDDFGSGLSSYSYLKVLPVDYLKIDGAFVKDIHADQNNYAVVKSINEIAHFMGKRTIAEYVENTEILRCLAEIGVDYAQGYGIEKPRLLEDLAQSA